MAISSVHKEILLTQSESKTLPEWVEYFDGKYSKSAICSFCHRNGKMVKKLDKETLSSIQSQNARKWHINQDYFKTWSRNMAYVLGLWFADGCIYGGKMFDITLHAKDKYILKQVAKELQYDGPLYDYVDRQAARLNFSCVVLYKDIVNLGGTEQKSLITQFPKVPEEYLSDFIRGYFDGDGNVYQVKNSRLGSSFTCGNPQFIKKLWAILQAEAGIKGGSYNAKNMILSFGKRDTLLLGDYMYKDNPKLFLLRKRNKFMKEDI